jgi:Protein of unknown function (DUF1353)
MPGFYSINLVMIYCTAVRFVLLLLIVPTVGCPLWTPPPKENFGKFIGRVAAAWVDASEREMILIEPFGYIDPDGNQWDSPAGSVIDGASIPKFAWSYIGGPFEGKHRNASVIHDVACEQKQRPWDKTHEIFYYAMRASGVGYVLANTMYAAVYHFGPRWEETVIIQGDAQFGFKGVEETVNEIKARRDPKNKFDVSVDRPTMPGEQATIRVEITPPSKDLSESQFEELRSLINKRAASDPMSLEEIRNFSPSQR